MYYFGLVLHNQSAIHLKVLMTISKLTCADCIWVGSGNYSIKARTTLLIILLKQLKLEEQKKSSGGGDKAPKKDEKLEEGEEGGGGPASTCGAPSCA